MLERVSGWQSFPGLTEWLFLSDRSYQLRGNGSCSGNIAFIQLMEKEHCFDPLRIEIYLALLFMRWK